MTKTFSTIRILGIDFFQGSVEDSIAASLQGGLVVAPSGPGLADMKQDAVYEESLQKAAVVLPDSGLMVALWNLFFKPKAIRLSGYIFLKALLEEKTIQAPDSSFWVMPSEKERDINLSWLNQTHGFALTENDCYLAPFYQDLHIRDQALLQQIESRQPRFIIINIGGGIQEKLGYYLQEKLSYRPTIICTGAAIAFMTGQQASIPLWADTLYLGWLFRILQSPKKFFPRYWHAKKLIYSLLRHQDKSPR